MYRVRDERKYTFCLESAENRHSRERKKMRKKMEKLRQQGFTFIEVLVVVGILGMILAALENAPENPTILGSLGSAYANAGDYEKAAKYLNAALALVPDDRRFIKVLKEVYGATGEQEKLSQLEEREKLIE